MPVEKPLTVRFIFFGFFNFVFVFLRKNQIRDSPVACIRLPRNNNNTYLSIFHFSSYTRYDILLPASESERVCRARPV